MSNERYYFDSHDLMDGDSPLRDTDIMDRLNEQDDDITRLRAAQKELLTALDGFAFLGANIHNIRHDPILFERLFKAAIEDMQIAVAKAMGEQP